MLIPGMEGDVKIPFEIKTDPVVLMKQGEDLMDIGQLMNHHQEAADRVRDTIKAYTSEICDYVEDKCLGGTIHIIHSFLYITKIVVGHIEPAFLDRVLVPQLQWHAIKWGIVIFYAKVKRDESKSAVVLREFLAQNSAPNSAVIFVVWRSIDKDPGAYEIPAQDRPVSEWALPL